MRMIGLKEIRRQKGYSQLKVAMDLNMTREAISYYENGKRNPDLVTLLILSKYFGRSIDYLITGKICTLTDPRLSEQANHVMDTISALQDLSREDLMILLIVKLLNR